MGKKLFRNSLFGYNRKDVSTYFESVSDEFKSNADKKDIEISELKEKLKCAEVELIELRKSKEEFESIKESISRAIIQAENKAMAIIEEAKHTATEEKFKIQNEALEEAAKLRRLKQDTSYMRRSVIALINRFNGELEEFSDKS